MHAAQHERCAESRNWPGFLLRESVELGLESECARGGQVCARQVGRRMRRIVDRSSVIKVDFWAGQVGPAAGGQL